jgi:adenylate cyclase
VTGSRGRRLAGLWAAGVAASLLVSGASALGYLERLQVATLDLLQGLGGQRFPPEVVVVAVDDAAFAGLGARQPLPRDYLARVVRGIRRSGAAALGLDIALSVATTPEADGALARAILDAGRVVLADTPLPASGPLADPAFVTAVARGSDRIPIDPDGVIRRVAPVVPEGEEGRTLASLGLALLAQVDRVRPGPPAPPLRGDLRDYPRWPRWPADAGAGWTAGGGPSVPLRAGELWRIGFVGSPGSFLTVPSDAVAVLGEPGGPEVAEDNPLRGRIVLLGATFADSRDFFQTPVGRMAGVEIHASIAHMLATRTVIRPAGWLVGLAVQLVAVLVAGVLLAGLRPIPGTLAALGATLAAGVPASYLAFHGAGYAVDFVLPVAVTCLLGAGAELLARRRFRDSFGRYVGRELLARVLAEDPALRGDRREVSVLVSDLRGFTTLSESLPPDRVAAHLNEYFPAMIDAIFAHGGMVNDFIGDGILAVFGAPLRDPDHASRAAGAALAMQAALDRLNREWTARELPALRMGIGIHTGPVFAGNVGGAARIKYTVIGDTVNVAARLEGVNKDLGTAILLTEETRMALGARAEARYRGEVPVKGRGQPLRVHELLALRPGEGAPGGGRERGGA